MAHINWPIHVIGVGGIGAALIHELTKLDIHEVHLWDDDEVEDHNLKAQTIYRPSDVGKPKVVAAYDFLERQEVTKTCQVICHAEQVTESTQLTGVVISCVDSMLSRCKIWDAIKWNPGVPLYLDGRMGGEEIQLLTLLNPINPNNEWYSADWLFDDDEGSDDPCAEPRIIHPPTVLAGWILTQLTLFARQLPIRNNLRANLRTMQFVVD